MIADMKRVMVNFTDEQWTLLEKFRGLFGRSDSEIVKYIVMAYLSEKTYVKDEMAERLDKQKGGVTESEGGRLNDSNNC